MIRIGVLVSGSGSNLQSIIDACGRGAIDGEVSIVLSNAKGAYALERARNRGIPTRVISPAEYPDRETFDRELAGPFTNTGSTWWRWQGSCGYSRPRSSGSSRGGS